MNNFKEKKVWENERKSKKIKEREREKEKEEWEKLLFNSREFFSYFTSVPTEWFIYNKIKLSY